MSRSRLVSRSQSLPWCALALTAAFTAALPNSMFPSAIALAELVDGIAQPPGHPLLPVPDEASRQKALSLVRDVYGDQLAQARQPEQKLKLAQKLFNAGEEERKAMDGRYVLLSLARENAVAGGSLELASKAIEALATSHRIDAIKLNAEAAAGTARALRSVQERKAFVNELEALVGGAADNDRYDLAVQMSQLAVDTAKVCEDAELSKHATAQLRQVRQIQTAYAELKAAEEILLAKPTDPSANLKVGLFRCLVKRDWKAGLPLLAKGSDQAVRMLAIQELSADTSPSHQMAVADGWWELSQKFSGSDRAAMRSHASGWYQLAVVSLEKGLERAKVERRIQEAMADSTSPSVAVASASSIPIPAGGQSATRPATGASAGVARLLTGTQAEDVVTLVATTKPYGLDGIYTVSAGKRLEIEAGAVIVCQARSQLVVNGTLVVFGTAEKPVEFRGAARQANTWKGILLDGVSDTSLRQVRVFDAESAVTIFRSKPTFNSCVFANNGIGLCIGPLSGYGGGTHEAVLEDCVSSFNKGDGIHVHGGAVNLTSCTVTKNGGWGIIGAYYVKVQMKSSILSLNDLGGVSLSVYESAVAAENSVLAGNRGPEVENKSTPEWDLRGNYWGPKLTTWFDNRGAMGQVPGISGKVRLDGFLHEMPKECGAIIREINGHRLW